MQFSVPQFTDVEDKLIGSLTLKQFLILLGAGGMVLFFWSLLGPSIIFFFLATPIALLGVGIALGRYNGRPMFTYLMPFVSFISSDKVMVFKRETSNASPQVAVKKEVVKELTPDEMEPTESRLKKLAYMLDRKTEQQKELLSKEEEKMIQVAATMPKVNLSEVLTRSKANLTKSNLAATLAKKLEQVQHSAESELSFEPERKLAPKKKKFDPSDFLNV